MKVPFYELDALIEKTTGLSLAEIFDLEGQQMPELSKKRRSSGHC